MKAKAIFVFLAFSALLNCGNVQAKLVPLVDTVVKFDDAQPTTAAQVHDYIIAGADRYIETAYSKLEFDSHGEIRFAFAQGRNNSFRVAITYDETGFQIKYLSSSPSLKYRVSDGEPEIHPNYVKWINGLVKEIKIARQLRLNARGEPTDPKLAAHLVFSGPDTTAYALSYADDVYERPSFTGYVPPKSTKIYGYSSIEFIDKVLTCGPICLEFEPTGGHSYEARWIDDKSLGTNGGCILSVHDISDGGDQTVAISRATCPVAKGWLARWLD